MDKNFYPTPAKLISQMWKKVDTKRVTSFLEPSAGKGDILDYVVKQYDSYGYGRIPPFNMACIELDYDLRSILIGKKYRVIDSDFISYVGMDKFDLIMGNPPFDTGDFHLLKAIDILYSGVNIFLENIRKDYWNKVLSLKEVKEHMTKNEKEKLLLKIQTQAYMDFTENNIREFVLQLIGNYEDILNKATVDLFDTFTQKYNWNEECSKNIHYFNGWKTNKAFYVNIKVIIPYNQYSSYDHPFFDFKGGLRLNYDIIQALHDIDIVMNYFTYDAQFISMEDALITAFANKETKKVESTHFIISIYKKGTMHITFRNEDTRRRFNIVACKNKKWLPEDYGKKMYNKMSTEEKEIVKSFEGVENYKSKLGQIGYNKNNRLMITNGC